MRGHVRFSFLCLLLIVCLVPAFASVSAAEVLPRNYSDALKVVSNNQPMEASAMNVIWEPKKLLEIRNTLPEGAVFHFSSKWNNIVISDDMEILDLTKVKDVLKEGSLRQILTLCPNLKTVDNSSHNRPSNDVFIPLMEEYPDIHFEWVVHLRGEHYCPTNATAYSTLNHTDYGARLSTSDMELLQYIPGLKALDVGHNTFADLSFLRFFPDLELLIISNNTKFEDLTPIGELKHLKYLELHNTGVSDLSPLAGCTELLDLNISTTQVTDLSPLDGVTSLERLWANHIGKMPEEEISRFRALHPNCLVDFTFDASATSHNWRSHPRYDHYRKCFTTNVWIPFDEPASGE